MSTILCVLVKIRVTSGEGCERVRRTDRMSWAPILPPWAWSWISRYLVHLMHPLQSCITSSELWDAPYPSPAPIETINAVSIKILRAWRCNKVLVVKVSLCWSYRLKYHCWSTSCFVFHLHDVILSSQYEVSHTNSFWYKLTSSFPRLLVIEVSYLEFSPQSLSR